MQVPFDNGTDSSGITFNPFAEHDSLLTTPPIDTSPDLDNHRPKLRCGSGSDYTTASISSSTSSVSIDHRRTGHVRAQTEVLAAQHPLRYSGSAPGPSDANITRPTLTRWVNVGSLVDVSVNGSPKRHYQKVVLIHEVSAKDSLAGVSLKYGISLADLRRSNHLWTSDSIHLRKVLYIPLDKCSRPQDLITNGEPFDISLMSAASDATDLNGYRPDLSTLNRHATANGHDTDPKHHTIAGKSPSLKLRRVPISQLSFFPPSASKPNPPNRSTKPPSTIPSRPSIHTRYTSSPSNSLGTLFTALPIPVSTRDTIISRLSLDSSTSSSCSDRDREAEDGERLELDDVPIERRRYASEDGISSQFPMTPRPPYRTTNGIKSSSSSPPSPTRIRGSIAMESTHARSYHPLHSSTVHVRNVQLEPSPGMQLPIHDANYQQKTSSRPNSRGKARRRLASVDFDVEPDALIDV
ncbi:peptidoglycan-binding LysM domain protein [Desarmillaria tabescens]|uniref:Peptidoglycan-binding LysM domain protein n=1 Tax=Armillaria tabescens TaxID=1929756 RepID=A0AA39N362_ARMTA|nr:peptidoglycan-binding LysM domain protein [Desarmillaria tabescens]KAK0455510.1 peptidoglycan-binding LysM domain protein [Desarmillaria tabescens]